MQRKVKKAGQASCLFVVSVKATYGFSSWLFPGGGREAFLRSIRAEERKVNLLLHYFPVKNEVNGKVEGGEKVQKQPYNYVIKHVFVKHG